MDRYRAARRQEASQGAPRPAPDQLPDGNPFDLDNNHIGSPLRPEAIDSCLGQFYDE